MKVKCINNENSNLTIGKVYNVIEFDNVYLRFNVINDNRFLDTYYASRFEIVPKSLDKQLDEAIEELFSKVVKIYHLPYGQEQGEYEIIKKQLLQFIENNNIK